jgi:hypothetical protein
MMMEYDFAWGWVLGFDGDLADVILGFIKSVVSGGVA